MLEVCENDATVDGIVALQTHALTTALRRHTEDGFVVNTKVDLVANNPRKSHGRGFVFRDVAGTSTGILIVCVDEVERTEKVGRVELLVKLVSLRDAGGEENVEKVMKE